MKSRSRRSSSSRRNAPAVRRAAGRRNAGQPYSSAGTAQMRGRRPLLRKTRLIPYPARRKKNVKSIESGFRPYPADRPLESGAAEKRARPNPARMCRTAARKAHGFSAVLTISRKAGRLSGAPCFCFPVRRPSASGRICARAQQSALPRFCDARRAEQIEINTRYTRGKRN